MERIRMLSANAGMVCLEIPKTTQDSVWGRLKNIYRKDAIPCKNPGDMLLKLDRLCEELDFPMACMATRSFKRGREQKRALAQPELYHPVNAFNPYEQLRQNTAMGTNALSVQNIQAVFYIQVLCRQNASMQGNVVWKGEKNNEQSFRSALELMKLIQGVLNGEEDKNDREEALQDNGVCG